jgi:hypothetical protein
MLSRLCPQQYFTTTTSLVHWEQVRWYGRVKNWSVERVVGEYGGSRDVSDSARRWPPVHSLTIMISHIYMLHGESLHGSRRTTRYLLGAKLTFQHDGLILALHREWRFVFSFLVISATPWTAGTTGGGRVQCGPQTHIKNSVLGRAGCRPFYPAGWFDVSGAG